MPKETNCTIIENEIIPKEPAVGTLYIPLHDFCLGMCESSWAWSSGSKACGAMRGGGRVKIIVPFSTWHLGPLLRVNH